MDRIWANLGGVMAIGLGLGVALAASMGAIGYAVGLIGTVAVVVVSRVVRARLA